MNMTPPAPDRSHDRGSTLASTIGALSIAAVNAAPARRSANDDSESSSNPSTDCWLPLELIESVLIAAVALVMASERQHLTAASSKSVGLHKTTRALANLLVLATRDIQPVACVILPHLLHAWPPTNAAVQGRLDILELARGFGMVQRWLADSPTAFLFLVKTANARGHADVLRWIHAHWRQDLIEGGSRQFLSMIDNTIVHTASAFSGTRGADMLEFWIVESGVDVSQVLTDVAKMTQAVHEAFVARNGGVLRWWANHSNLLGDQDMQWDWNWVEQAVRDGNIAGVDVCADMCELGHVSFIAKRRQVSQLSAGSIVSEVVRVSERIVDLASQVGQVDLLEKWIQRQESRGLPVVYSEEAMDLCESPSVLDWWLKSGLPLKYSHVALHRATATRNIKVLDWWLAAYRNGSIPELKYDSWIMTLASCDCTIHSSYGVSAINARPCSTGSASTLSVVQWWDDSQLDLKLPSDSGLQAGITPSPIDLCTDPAVLDWWLNRALRFCSSNTSIQHHFPRFTQVAMHRAAYWNRADVLDWWLTKGKKAACLELFYSPHRMIELAVMTPPMQQRTFGLDSSSLSWCLQNLPTVQFRGSLMEWVQTSGSGFTFASSARDARASRGMRTGSQTAMENVKKICAKYVAHVSCEDGGLPSPEGGYARQEQGEKFVFY